MTSPVGCSAPVSRMGSPASSDLPALCQEVTPDTFWQNKESVPRVHADECKISDVERGVISFEIRDCITLFAISWDLNLSFAIHINGLMGASDDDQEKRVREIFKNAELVSLDQKGSYRGAKFDLALVGGTSASHSEQLARMIEKVMPEFFDVKYYKLDKNLLNPDREGREFITAYLSPEGKIEFYFHSEESESV